MAAKGKQSSLTLFVLIAFLLSIGGCRKEPGSEPTNQKSVDSGNEQKGYLSADDNSTMFIRWTEVNNKLNGQLNIFYAKGKRGKSTETSSHSFEGVSDGKSISINFTGSVWINPLAGKTWTGTVTGNDLTLVIPDKSGILVPVRFRASSVEEYNRLVTGIQQGVSTENAKIQKEEADAARFVAEQKAVIAAVDKVRSIINDLADNIKLLQEDSHYEENIKAYARTWDEMQSHYLSLKAKAARSPLTSTQFYDVQSALYTLQSDIYSMDSNSYSLQNSRDRASNKIKTAEEHIAKLQIAWEQVMQAKAANTTGKPEIPITSEMTAELIKHTQGEIAKARASLEEAMKKTSAFDKQARDLYRRAEVFVKSLKPIDQ